MKYLTPDKKQQMDILTVTWRMDGCVPGIDNSLDNPLTRATDCLFRLGRPFFRLSKCFFIGQDGIIRWMGIFVYSAGERILFFPGFAQPQSHVLGYSEDVLRWDQPFQIDHLSLESDRRTWHFTAPKSVEHLGNLSTRRLDSDRVHWFSMSAAAPENLRVVHEDTRVVAPTPPQDVDRRAEVFRRTRENAEFQFVRLNTEHTPPGEPAFLHFSVVIGPKGFSSPENEILGLPHGGPFLTSSSSTETINAPIRLHRILLSEDVELEINASSLPGKLRTPLLFTAPIRSVARHY